MVNGIRTRDLCGLNKGCGSKFQVDFQVQQTPEEGWRTYRPKCEYNKKDEENSLKTLNNKKKELFIFIKMDLVLNNLQWLICHETKPTKVHSCSDW